MTSCYFLRTVFATFCFSRFPRLSYLWLYLPDVCDAISDRRFVYGRLIFCAVLVHAKSVLLPPPRSYPPAPQCGIPKSLQREHKHFRVPCARDFFKWLSPPPSSVSVRTPRSHAHLSRPFHVSPRSPLVRWAARTVPTRWLARRQSRQFKSCAMRISSKTPPPADGS